MECPIGERSCGGNVHLVRESTADRCRLVGNRRYPWLFADADGYRSLGRRCLSGDINDNFFSSLKDNDQVH